MNRHPGAVNCELFSRLRRVFGSFKGAFFKKISCFTPGFHGDRWTSTAAGPRLGAWGSPPISLTSAVFHLTEPQPPTPLTNKGQVLASILPPNMTPCFFPVKISSYFYETWPPSCSLDMLITTVTSVLSCMNKNPLHHLL